jgi:hypothetical protein
VLETSHAIIVIHNHPYKLIINPLEVGAFSRTNLQQMVSVCVCVCVRGLFAGLVCSRTVSLHSWAQLVDCKLGQAQSVVGSVRQIVNKRV